LSGETQAPGATIATNLATLLGSVVPENDQDHLQESALTRVNAHQGANDATTLEAIGETDLQSLVSLSAESVMRERTIVHVKEGHEAVTEWREIQETATVQDGTGVSADLSDAEVLLRPKVATNRGRDHHRLMADGTTVSQVINKNKTRL